MIRARLLAKIAVLDEELESLFDALKSYSQDQMDTKQAPGVWSPSEVLQHILLSETLSLAYCKKKLSFEPELKKANIISWFNARLINWSLISPFKFKAPKEVSSSQLNTNESFEDFVARYKLCRKELALFVAEVPEKYIDREVYKHPLGMRMSINGMLDFYKNHFRRHRKQLLARLS
jgi:hypothetical protein